MSDAGDWCLIESDPGVFTEMLKGFGASGLQVEELYSLDDVENSSIKPIYGLIFLFKWQQGDEPSGTPSPDAKVFFAQQVITNACATQALINLVMNISDPDVTLGETLQNFKEFALDFSSKDKGYCMSNSESLRTVHNGFARQNLYEIDSKHGESDENYHFVAYVPVGNKVYELDGLREFPIESALIPENGDWLSAVSPVIQERMQKYSEGEIRFNLMAVIPNKKMKYNEILKNLIEANADHSLDDQVAEIYRLIHDEDEKDIMYHKENQRRRHNYLPLLVDLMKILAKEGKLVELVDNAIQIAEQRQGSSSAKSLLKFKE